MVKNSYKYNVFFSGIFLIVLCRCVRVEYSCYLSLIIFAFILDTNVILVLMNVIQMCDSGYHIIFPYDVECDGTFGDCVCRYAGQEY